MFFVTYTNWLDCWHSSDPLPPIQMHLLSLFFHHFPPQFFCTHGGSGDETKASLCDICKCTGTLLNDHMQFVIMSEWKKFQVALFSELYHSSAMGMQWPGVSIWLAVHCDVIETGALFQRYMSRGELFMNHKHVGTVNSYICSCFNREL